MKTPEHSPLSAWSRRDFMRLGAGLGTASLFAPSVIARETLDTFSPALGPVAIASSNGLKAVEKAYQLMKSGSDALDAVIAGVNIVEDDPEDNTVGYGGIPNEEGVVELDAACMHGPTHRAGAVAALKGIKNPSKVARLVMQRTDHVLLVDQGALKFAKMHGFKEENLLTEASRELWVQWKETLSTKDDYLPPHKPSDKDIGMHLEEIKRRWGTIHCSGLDASGNLSSVTTTSGLFFKIPGRVGDSPIIGAGIFTDNEVGSAGSTGRGEANLQNCSSVMIVERMRAGDSPSQACLYACRRIAEHTKHAYLLDKNGRPNFNVKFYAINKKGEVGGAEMLNTGGHMAICDANGARQIALAYLFDR